MSNQIAEIILDQLGGNKFITMTGAKNISAFDDGIQFQIGKNSKKITHIKICLNAFDTYDISFFNVRGFDCKEMAVVKGVYADTLQRVFTRETGLDTHL